MGYTLSHFQAKANEAHKGLVVEDEDGTTLFTLRPALRLSDAETDRLENAQTTLKEYQENKETPTRPSELKKLLVDMLAILADKPQALRSWIRPADLAIVTEFFKEYQAATEAPEGN